MRAPALRSHVAPFQVMEVVKAAARRQETHGDVILLCVGQPATPAPAVVLDAARRAVTDGVLGYTEAAGIPQLRAAIAEHYAGQGISVDPDEVLVTTGSSGGFVLALLAATDPGDVVAFARPGYPAYRNDAFALGCAVVELDCGPESRYQPTAEQLAALVPRPAVVILGSPANPTGTIVDPDQLRSVALWCADNGVTLLSDEIYHGISYGRPCVSAWQYSRDAVVVGSVSKYHSMTGWRLGWLLMPPGLRRNAELLQGNLAICAPAISQLAAVQAFSPEATVELDGHVQRYARNREVVLRRLPELGINRFAPPDGAFYAYCDVSHLTDDSLAWCAQVLDQTGVALAPGVDFDTVAGHSTMRLSFCGETAQLEEAFDRLTTFVNR